MIHEDQIRTDILRIFNEKDKEIGRIFFNEGIIDYKHAQKWLIGYRFWEERRKDQIKTNLQIMDELSIEYDVTIRHIKYLINGK